MTPTLALLIVIGYFGILVMVAHYTAGTGDNQSFFTANRQSPWYLVAFGMIGTSLSGVTFISVPGWVSTMQFGYMQMVLGYLLGYLVIVTVLMPLYYRLNLVSIYTYLEERFGFWSYKTGAFFFLVSRTVGASFRLFLVAGVLQLAMFDAWGVPFWLTVLIAIALIWLYTFRGGIKTIVWTDAMQTFFMLSAVVVTIAVIGEQLEMSVGMMIDQIFESKNSKVFVWEWRNPNHFVKKFLSGAFIAIVMTGLDQDMMQKNLTCRNISEAQKNMTWFSIVLVFVNLLFLALGALFLIYMERFDIALPPNKDDMYPMLALEHFPLVAGVLFLLGITAAAYSSADSALTSLTTSFCVDFLGEENMKKSTRWKVHVGFSLLLFIVIIVFRIVNDQSVISAVFKVAGYTYGPLLGLYTFGLLTKRRVIDKYVPMICLLSPILSYGIDLVTKGWFGFFILVINGGLTFLGLLMMSQKQMK